MNHFNTPLVCLPRAECHDCCLQHVVNTLHISALHLVRTVLSPVADGVCDIQRFFTGFAPQESGRVEGHVYCQQHRRWLWLEEVWREWESGRDSGERVGGTAERGRELR